MLFLQICTRDDIYVNSEHLQNTLHSPQTVADLSSEGEAAIKNHNIQESKMLVTDGGYQWGATHCKLCQGEPQNELKKQCLNGAQLLKKAECFKIQVPG